MVKRKKTKKTRDSPAEKRMREKDGEVAIARGRLAGALKGILNNTEDLDETDVSGSQSSNSSSKKFVSDNSVLWKRHPPNLEPGDHQLYVMKLFDRSVDLAQFNVNTPLYPICRAWIQNKPNLSKKKDNQSLGLSEIRQERNESDSQLIELNERANSQKSEETDVFKLPPPKPLPEGVQTLRVPRTEPRVIEEINLNPDADSTPSREELLSSHLKNWSKVRKRWRLASFKNEERYGESKEIFAKMFERLVDGYAAEM